MNIIYKKRRLVKLTEICHELIEEAQSSSLELLNNNRVVSNVEEYSENSAITLLATDILNQINCIK